MAAEILCATDLTATSGPALERALRLGEELGVAVTVLHVVAPPFPDPDYVSLAAEDSTSLESVARRVRRAAEVRITELVRATRDALGLVRVEARPAVCEGLPAATIVEEASRRGAELIVVGTQARTGLPHLLLGSVAERVMRTAPCPVLTVPPWA